VLSGQPFDTTKVRLQSAPEGTYSGALDVVKKLVKTEGFSGFYKGTLTPLIGGRLTRHTFLIKSFTVRLIVD
jgi:solute carrier family 25 carnitine/acylcarnitine transporter 20/29